MKEILSVILLCITPTTIGIALSKIIMFIFNVEMSKFKVLNITGIIFTVIFIILATIINMNVLYPYRKNYK